MPVARSTFDKWQYRQYAGECVLAAYAAALWPFTTNAMDRYLAAYVAHFKLPIGKKTPVAAYNDDFHVRAQSSPGGGFGILHDLHCSSQESVFTDSRTKAILSFLPSGAAGWPRIYESLSGPKPATAVLFINDNPGSPFSSMHAVMAAYDGELYAYDSNVGVVPLPSGKAQLGLLGHSFIVAAP